MAQMIFFHYMHKHTPLHIMDGRLKLLCMLLLTISVSKASQWQHYIALICVMGLALVIAKLLIIVMLKEMKFFAVMIVIVFVINVLSTPGDPIPHFSVGSIQDVTRGLHFTCRLVLMLMISTVMAGTTPLSILKNTIEWYLRLIPFIPEVPIATIINLTFVLIPVIFGNYLEIMNVQKARCLALSKNLIKRIRFIVFPLLSRTLRRADELVYAMESRCYSETRTRVMFKISKADWLIWVVCIAVLIIVTIRKG